MEIKVLPLALVGIGGFIAFKALSKTVTIKNLLFQIRGIQPTFQNFQPKLKIRLGIQNPTADDLNLNGLFGDVYINGDLAGDVAATSPILIQPLLETPYTLDVRLNAVPLVIEILQMILGNTPVQAKFQIVGTVNVENLPFRIDLTYKLV